jgi:uncharacterized membrane protein
MSLNEGGIDQMKQRAVPLRAALYAALLLAMVLSAIHLYEPKAAAGICCKYGIDCRSTHTLCCAPGSEMADCSPTMRNYCLSACPLP